VHYPYRATLVVAAVAVLAVPAGASAATKTVQMGLPSSSQKTFQNKYGSDVNAYFPSTTTIHVGDTVKFQTAGEFHTVDIPARGSKPLGLIVPSGKTASGVNDAAGNPFWFNGQPTLMFNPAILKSNFGKTVTFTGAKRIQSGAPLGNKIKPMSVKFTKAGTYSYFCTIHAGMKGTVKVVSAKSSVPSAAADKAAVKRQLASDAKTAAKLPKTIVPAGVVSVGGSGPGGVEFYGMLPGKTTVKVGTTLTFQMSSASFEDHTASFGTDNPEVPPSQAGYLGKLSQTFQGPGPFDPIATYPSDPPGTPATLNPSSHGNGFWNSGVMDRSSATPLPPSNRVTFDTPGTYNFYCLIHPFMHGQVIVQ
jgi:plastocyanin